MADLPGRRRAVVPVEAWPRADRDAWLVALSQGDAFEDVGIAARWAPATQASAGRGYGRWLKWRRDSGHADQEYHIAAGVTPAAIAEYVAFLKTVVETSSAVAYLSSLRMAVIAMAPDQDWDWMKGLIARLKRAATPVRDKGAGIVGANELFQFGLDLMAESGAEAAITKWQQAIDHRDGLMIALLAARPLRRNNFISIEIGKHLVERGDELWLQFDRAETKNHEPIEVPVPERLVSHLHHYLETVRPWLCAQTSHRDPRFSFRAPGDRLWVSKTGSAMSPEVFYSMIRERTEARFGRAVYPHLFRHNLATQVATDDPDRILMTQRLLGHKSARTTEWYYIHAQTHQANQRVQEHIGLQRRIARRCPKSSGSSRSAFGNEVRKTDCPLPN